MKKRLFICALLIATGCLFIPSCQFYKTQPVIGLLMDQFNVERWAYDSTYFIKTVNGLGGKVICYTADGDINKQMEQAKKLIAENVDVIVIVPVDTKKAADIVMAVKKEEPIPIISYDRLIQDSYIDYYISFDNAKVGELQADYIITRMQKGNIALIGGPPSDQNAFYMRYGQLGVLEPYVSRGDVKIVFDKMVNDWTFDEGYRLAMECLKNNKVDAIIAGNDLLARGVIKALEEKGLLDKVLVAGQDADTQACENIVLGKQAMSVYKPIDEIASNAAKMAMDLANGKEIDNTTNSLNNGFKMVPSLLLKPMVVNKGNIGMQFNIKK
jgi:D-xylose transport system substrate-binding protein